MEVAEWKSFISGKGKQLSTENLLKFRAKFSRLFLNIKIATSFSMLSVLILSIISSHLSFYRGIQRCVYISIDDIIRCMLVMTGGDTVRKDFDPKWLLLSFSLCCIAVNRLWENLKEGGKSVELLLERIHRPEGKKKNLQERNFGELTVRIYSSPTVTILSFWIRNTYHLGSDNGFIDLFCCMTWCRECDKAAA